MRGACGARIAFTNFAHVRFSGPVAVFTADGQLLERRIQESAVAAQHRLRPPAVARDAAGKYRAIETIVAKLIPGRERPRLSF